jgi:hypothetical protein
MTAPVTLIPLRVFSDAAPVIIAPHGVSSVWSGCKRLNRCEIYSLPDDEAVFSVWFWTPLIGRDVTFWPIDVRSSQVMTLIVQNLLGRHPIFRTLRWAWGHPSADELGEPDARVDTLYRSTVTKQQAA